MKESGAHLLHLIMDIGELEGELAETSLMHLMPRTRLASRFQGGCWTSYCWLLKVEIFFQKGDTFN